MNKVGDLLTFIINFLNSILQGEDAVSCISMLFEEIQTVCGQQVSGRLQIVESHEIHLYPSRMFTWNRDEEKVGEQAIITIPATNTAPISKLSSTQLNIQNNRSPL